MSDTARYLLIVNPKAKHGDGDRATPVIERLLAHLPHELVETQAPGHATELAAGASDFDVVVAVGGDGTVHEVLNGLMRIPAERRPALGILPTGSGNDACRTYGIPFDLAQAALTLGAGCRGYFDVGSCNELFFNNSFAAGLDARVTAKAVEYKVTKRRSGLWLYLTALLHVLFNDLHPIDVRVSFDDETATTENVLIVAVTNGRTYGGGFRITPDADPRDGLFDVCMIEPLRLTQALWRLPFVVLGRHTGMGVVRMSRHSKVVVEADAPIAVQTDGEVLLGTHYEIGMLHRAIEVVVPREA